MSPSDIRAALARTRISLDFPAAESTVDAPPPVASRPPREPGAARKTAARFDVTVKQLLDAGLIQSGAQLRKRYLGDDVTATIEADGRTRFGDEVFDSLSTAGGAARVNVKGATGRRPTLLPNHGWNFWEYVDATGAQWSMEALRKKYVDAHS